MGGKNAEQKGGAWFEPNDHALRGRGDDQWMKGIERRPLTIGKNAKEENITIVEKKSQGEERQASPRNYTAREEERRHSAWGRFLKERENLKAEGP